MTGFESVLHGFSFPNAFPTGTPVFKLDTPFGAIPIGNAGGGLCGGMVFAALDYFENKVPRPQELSPALFGYLGRRLLDSWDLPYGVLKYYEWQRRPSVTRSTGYRIRGLTRLTIQQEWPRIRKRLDAGQPVPLGLIKVWSWNPRQLPLNHQVLTHGYRLEKGEEELHLFLYDPNYPNDDTTLTLKLTDPDAGHAAIHNREGPTVRGFFMTRYRKPSPFHVVDMLNLY